MLERIICLLFTSLVHLPLFSCQENTDGRVEEFCLSETFRPDCSNNDLIIVKKAKYGRMKIGKCLTEKEMQMFGGQGNAHHYLGCYNDVTNNLNSKCGLKKSCEVKIIDLEGIENTACHLGLKMYLEVHYSCLPVIYNKDNCQIFATSRAKYLSPHTFKELSCGSKEKLLLVEAPKGQRIKITLELFPQSGLSNADGGRLGHTSCSTEIGLIVDKHRNTNFTICQEGIIQLNNQVGVTKEIISQGNFVNIALFEKKVNVLTLIKIEADGCLDIIPPEDTWLKRNNDDIVVGCYSSKQTWYIRCENKQWVGAIGNCSALNSAVDTSAMDTSDIADDDKLVMSSTQQVLIIVAISGFGFVICLLILCIGGFCLKRFNAKDIKEAKYYNVSHGKYSNNTFNQTYYKQSIETPADGMLNNRGQSGPFYMADNVDDDRYQVLDRDEVAKENANLA